MLCGRVVQAQVHLSEKGRCKVLCLLPTGGGDRLGGATPARPLAHPSREGVEERTLFFEVKLRRLQQATVLSQRSASWVEAQGRGNPSSPVRKLCVSNLTGKASNASGRSTITPPS
jgi:hypothetical protein